MIWNRNWCSCALPWFPVCPVCWWQYCMAHDTADLPQPWISMDIYIYMDINPHQVNRCEVCTSMTMIHVSFLNWSKHWTRRWNFQQTLEESKPHCSPRSDVTRNEKSTSKAQLCMKCEEAWVFSQGLARPPGDPRHQTWGYSWESPSHGDLRWFEWEKKCEVFCWLVVGPPLWKIWKSIGMMIPNIWEISKCSKPPTSLGMLPSTTMFDCRRAIDCFSMSIGSKAS